MRRTSQVPSKARSAAANTATCGASHACSIGNEKSATKVVAVIRQILDSKRKNPSYRDDAPLNSDEVFVVKSFLPALILAAKLREEGCELYKPLILSVVDLRNDDRRPILCSFPRDGFMVSCSVLWDSDSKSRKSGYEVYGLRSKV